MKEFVTTHLVKSEDLNHHGTLFAARQASWFIEAAFIAVASEHGKPSEIVCRNVHGMSFKVPVENGALVQLSSRVVYTGTTSVMVYVRTIDALRGRLAVDGFVTFVTIDHATGQKIPHAIRLDEIADSEEIALREKAAALRKD